jgi:hypothetical protein
MKKYRRSYYPPSNGACQFFPRKEGKVKRKEKSHFLHARKEALQKVHFAFAEASEKLLRSVVRFQRGSSLSLLFRSFPSVASLPLLWDSRLHPKFPRQPALHFGTTLQEGSA